MTRRKVKQLTRQQTIFRDDRIFWISSDDRYAPRQYLGFLDVRGIRFAFLNDDDKTRAAEAALKDLQAISPQEIQPDDERWLILDTDHFTEESHLATFTRVLSEAERAGILVALSRPCFEYWLLLHHTDPHELDALTTAKQVKLHLKTILGTYNKARLKQQHYPIESIVKAFQRAKYHDAQISGGRIPLSNTSRMYRLLESILNSNSKVQLPDPLFALLSS